MLAPATRRLLIHNTGESFDTGWFRQAYELASKTDLLEIEPAKLSSGASPCLADPNESMRPVGSWVRVRPAVEAAGRG